MCVSVGEVKCVKDVCACISFGTVCVAPLAAVLLIAVICTSTVAFQFNCSFVN